MTPQRLLGADFLRAAACMMVLLHHLAFKMPSDKIPDVFKGIMSFFVMGSFGVSVFFMLSGFLLARPFWLALDKGAGMPDLGTYALRRAARILPGFWLALTVSLILSVTVSGSDLDAQQWVRYVAGMLLVSDWHWVTLFPVDNNGPLWSIGFEVTSYVLLPLCLVALFLFRGEGIADRLTSPQQTPASQGDAQGATTFWERATQRRFLARLVWVGIIGLVLVVHWLVVQFAPIDDVERGWGHGLVGGAKAWMPRFNPIGFFAIFALGALAAGVQIMVAHLRHWLFDVIGLAAVVAAAVVMNQHIGGLNEGFGWLDIPYGFPAMPIAVGIALVALPSSVLAGQLLDNGVSRYIAEISFGIYIWHFLIIGLMGRLAPPSFDTSGENAWSIWLWSSAIAIALSFAVATASFYLMERPVVRWARGLEHRDRTASAPAH